MNLYITKSTRKNKKYDLLDSNKKYLLSFGDDRYQDYTIHKDQTRQQRYIYIYIYISRHKKNEDWGKSGIYIYILPASGANTFCGGNLH